MTTEIAKHPLRDKIPGDYLSQYLEMTFPSSSATTVKSELNGEQLKSLRDKELKRRGLTQGDIQAVNTAFGALAKMSTQANSTEKLLSLLSKSHDLTRETGHHNPEDDDID